MTAAMTAGGTARVAEPAHHLTDELLLDYAAGSLDLASSLMVAAHLTYCPHCRAKARAMDDIGGNFLDTLEPAVLEEASLDAVLARIDGEPVDADGTRPPPPVANDNPVLPRVVQQYLGGDVDTAPWKYLGGGVETAEIPIPDTSGHRAFLLRVAAGRAVPQHTHTGNEFVLILDGNYVDEFGYFGTGDIAICDGSVTHKPVAGPDRACTCLVVIDAPIRLTGILGAILNPFVKL